MVSISNMQESKGYLSKKHIELFLLTISTYISNRAGRTKAAAGVLAFATPMYSNQDSIKGADYRFILIKTVFVLHPHFIWHSVGPANDM